ncbi:MAG: hypothetical protein ACOC38_04895 [Promethearchaeia archaeon]
MNTKQPRFMAPILLESYEEFKKFADKATVVTYNTEYFDSPFLDNSKRLRRLILHAVGVEMDGLPLTFKYVFEYGDLLSGSTAWDEQTNEADSYMRSMLEHLQTEYNLIKGTIETPQHSWKRFAVAKS